MRQSKRITILALFMTVSLSATGDKKTESEADLKAKIATDCAGLTDYVEVVQCRIDVQTSLKLPSEFRVVGSWVEYTQVDPITDQPVVLTKLLSSNGGEGELFVRCMREKTDLMLKWPFEEELPPREEPVEVRARIDKKEPVVLTWQMANQTWNTAFYRTNTVKFIKELLDSEKFAIEAMPDDGLGIMVFDTVGANDAMSGIRKACKW